MSSEPYTPTMEVVRDALAFPRERLGEPRPISPEAFDRFIAKVRAGALREAAQNVFDTMLPAECAQYLNERAQKLEETP